MANETTLALVDSIVKSYIDSEFMEGFDDHFPIIKDAVKHTPGMHEGRTCQFPSLIHRDEVTSATSEGSNVSAEEYGTSAVKVDLDKYGISSKPTIESIGASMAPFLKRMLGAQVRQYKRSVQLITLKHMAWAAPMIRADRDSNYQTFCNSTADGLTTAANVITSTDLIAVDDQYNGGRAAVIRNSGQGQARTVHDYTGATGVVLTGNANVTGPFQAGLDFNTELNSPGTADSYSLVSSTKGLTSADILNSDVISYGQFVHEQYFNTEPNDAANSWVLYVTPFGKRDLYEHDESFNRAMENYRGEFFDNPDNALAHWMDTTVKKINKGFRGGVTGGTTDAAYSATGSAHFYPLCGKEAFYITEIKLWKKGRSPGAVNFFAVTTPDSNNPDLAYFVFGWVGYFTAVPTFCTRVLNLACGTGQS